MQILKDPFAEFFYYNSVRKQLNTMVNRFYDTFFFNESKVALNFSRILKTIRRAELPWGLAWDVIFILHFQGNYPHLKGRFIRRIEQFFSIQMLLTIYSVRCIKLKDVSDPKIVETSP